MITCIRIGSHFTSAGSVEHTPHEQIVAKVLESMLSCGPHEKQVAGLKWIALAVVKQDTATANRDVQLVLFVWSLLIGARRCAEAHIERAALQDVDGALAGGYPSLGLGEMQHIAAISRFHTLCHFGMS